LLLLLLDSCAVCVPNRLLPKLLLLLVNSHRPKSLLVIVAPMLFPVAIDHRLRLHFACCCCCCWQRRTLLHRYHHYRSSAEAIVAVVVDDCVDYWRLQIGFAISAGYDYWAWLGAMCLKLADGSGNWCCCC